MKHLSSHLCTHILIAEIPNALGCSSNYENPNHKEHAHHKSESNINSEYDALDKHWCHSRSSGHGIIINI